MSMTRHAGGTICLMKRRGTTRSELWTRTIGTYKTAITVFKPSMEACTYAYDITTEPKGAIGFLFFRLGKSLLKISKIVEMNDLAKKERRAKRKENKKMKKLQKKLKTAKKIQQFLADDPVLLQRLALSGKPRSDEGA